MHSSFGRKKRLAQIVTGLALVAFLLSACTLPGTANVTASPTATPTVSGKGVTPAPTNKPRTVASIPGAASKLPNGVPLPGNQEKTLTFNLLYNDAAFDRAIQQMYTPGSSTYHHFLTPEQIVQEYAVSDAQLNVVKNWLTQSGYTILSLDPLRSGLVVQASVATIEKSLKIQLQSFTLGNRQFFMQVGLPTLSGPVAGLVQSVVGLDNFALPVFKPPFSGVHSDTSVQGNCSKYGTKLSLTRDRLASAYGINTLYQQGYRGQGMTIGVAEFDEPYSPADVANYVACTGESAPQIQNITVDAPTAAGSGEGEAAMDLELIAGLTPQAHILDYQVGTNNNAIPFAKALVDMLTRVATDHKVQVLSISYGTSDGNMSQSEQDAVNRVLRTLAGEGISVFVSSGDCGAFSDRIANVASVSFPASAPYAIAVGGTHLQVDANGKRTSEDVWADNDGAGVCQNEWGSGGGVSQNSDFARPSWQVGPGTTTHYDGSSSFVLTDNFTPVVAPNGLRQVPDVAAAAYPNIAIYYQGAWYAFGGTSAAAPIWAAGALLVDQGLQKQNKNSLGGVPTFYNMANHAGKFHPYTDITRGNNLFYSATSGWDYTTGWGSPDFPTILQLEGSLT